MLVPNLDDDNNPYLKIMVKLGNQPGLMSRCWPVGSIQGYLYDTPETHHVVAQVKCPVPCSDVTLTSGTEVGDLSTKVPVGGVVGWVPMLRVWWFSGVQGNH